MRWKGFVSITFFVLTNTKSSESVENFLNSSQIL
jgi:hypothetical protein